MIAAVRYKVLSLPLSSLPPLPDRVEFKLEIEKPSIVVVNCSFSRVRSFSFPSFLIIQFINFKKKLTLMLMGNHLVQKLQQILVPYYYLFDSLERKVQTGKSKRKENENEPVDMNMRNKKR